MFQDFFTPDNNYIVKLSLICIVCYLQAILKIKIYNAVKERLSIKKNLLKNRKLKYVCTSSRKNSDTTYVSSKRKNTQDTRENALCERETEDDIG